MNLKDLFKNKKDMATDNIENEQEFDDATIDANANAEQIVVEEKSVEEQLEISLAQEKDKFLRLFAEFENYKKRTAKERYDQLKTAGEDVISSLLPVLDDFDRAITEISKFENGPLLEGVILINDKLKNTLTSKGLEIVEVRAGDTFNADYAEAITQIPSPTPDLKGKIVDVIEKGYKLGDKIIRFPKVVIGQ